MIQLAFPLGLLLLVLPLFIRLLPPRDAAPEAMILPEAIAQGASTVSGPDGRRSPLIWALIWALLCLAFAQPERLVLVSDRSASGRDIVLALDMSGSMATPDFSLDGETITRLDAVKRVGQAFIRARTGDRIGLVIFADRAYVAAPLTHDLASVARALDEAQIGISGRSTNIPEGLGLALKRLLDDPSPSKVIVLLSDGKDTADRLDAAEVGALAAANAVRIHTVALGPEDLETRPTARDAVDTALLRRIAESSGGESFRVRTTEDLKAMAAALDRLEPNPSARPPVAEPRPLWIWPAALALLLAAFAGLGREI